MELLGHRAGILHILIETAQLECSCNNTLTTRYENIYFLTLLTKTAFS